MTEEKALLQSTGFHNDGRVIGYLPFMAANYLVGTGKYKFTSVCCWGYVIERYNEKKKVINMLKQMKVDNKYFVINIDEPYAEKIYNILKEGQKEKRAWPEGDISFVEWVQQTFYKKRT